MLPIKMPLETSIVSMSAVELKFMSKDGHLYSGGMTFKKSVDDGQNWTTLYTFATNIGYVEKTDKGNLLIALENGELWSSNDNELNFALAYNGLVASAGGSHTQRLTVYGNVVLTGEYQVAPTIGRGVAISKDYGHTWNKMTDLPEKTINHTHSIIYDPYEGLIWVAAGDSPNGCRIFFSDDYGFTWQTHSEGTYRVTCIIPLPDRVLFGADESHEIFFYEYLRVDRGTSGADIKISKAFDPIKYDSASIFGWVPKAAIEFGKNACAYFGFWTPFANNIVATVYKTDGKVFTPLWQHIEIPSSIPRGISAVFGPDKRNRIAAAFSINASTDNKAIIINQFVDKEEIYGVTATHRPLATVVNVGAKFFDITTGEKTISNGITWVTNTF